jgi:hypothetical protein
MEIKQVISECVTEAFVDGIDVSRLSNRKIGQASISASTLFSWACSAILKAFGEEWLDVGWIDMTHTHPVYAGDIIATRVIKRNDNSFELVMVNQDNLICASGWLGMGVNTAWLPIAKKYNAPPPMAISIATTSASSDDDAAPASDNNNNNNDDESGDEQQNLLSTSSTASIALPAVTPSPPSPSIHAAHVIPGMMMKSPSLPPPPPTGMMMVPRYRTFPLPVLKEVSTQPMEILPKSMFVSAAKAKDYVRREAKDFHNSIWFRSQNPPVHPGWIADHLAQLIQHSNRRLPVVCTNLKVQFFSRLVSGQRVTSTGHFRRAFDQNSNHVSVVDAILLAEQGQRIAQMQTTTMFQIRASL